MQRARPGGHERRPLEDRRHVGRMDRHTHRHPRAEARRRPARDVRPLRAGLRPRARDGRGRSGIDRPARRRDGDARHGVPVDGRAARRSPRHARRSGVRPGRGLHRLRVRDRAGPRDDRRRACAPRARRRRGRAVVDPRLDEPVDQGGFLGFELGADGGGGRHLWLPGSGTRAFDGAGKYVKMNGREVFRFATRVMVTSAEAILRECGKTVEDVDVYVPHQATVRIIDHAARKVDIPYEKIVVNVDRYGNASSGSIPLALADAADGGRLEPGKLVLLTGMGAGLTWGSALIDWTHTTTGATA